MTTEVLTQRPTLSLEDLGHDPDDGEDRPCHNTMEVIEPGKLHRARCGTLFKPREPHTPEDCTHAICMVCLAEMERLQKAADDLRDLLEKLSGSGGTP